MLSFLGLKKQDIYELAYERKWEKVKSILEKEPHRVNEKNWSGRTLGWLALKENLSILKYLVDKGLNLKQLDEVNGESLLHEAVWYEAEAVKYLIEQNMDLNHQDSQNKRTALHNAAYLRKFESVKVLVEAGASLDMKDKKGHTAVELAKTQNNQEIYEYLVAAKQQRSREPTTTTTSSNLVYRGLADVETQLQVAMAQIEQLKQEKSAAVKQIEELQASSVAWNNKYKAELLQLNIELRQSTLKTEQLQMQLRHVLATIPHEQLKVVKLIGKGGFAEVSLVEWQSKQYAFKCFHDEETASMCLKEASVAISLSCPYIVHIYGKTEEPAGMLVEYMNKGSLFTVLFKSKLTLSLPQKKQIALAVGNALALIHDRGVLHRDIKPDNVLIHGSEDNSELYAKVADFGTAKLINTKMTLATTGTSAFTGTLNFMAPELLNAAIAQIQAEVMGETSTTPPVTATKECDVYSFGVLLYELICEKQAYQGIAFSSGIQFMKHVASGKRPEIPNNCPAGWKALIEKCWHQDPKHRPTMKEVLGDLKKMSP